MQFATAGEALGLLSDPTRLRVAWLLAMTSADEDTLDTACGAPVTRHLAKPRLAGLIEGRREGPPVVCALRDGHLRRLVIEALNHADHLLSGMPHHRWFTR
ncbi:transcriptional regulator [Nonomuraea sp. NPDC049400]|uniref:transcriptional regulator n=1 Tax=Nonomuraea sp. NPDC049400 TaxID=3364352 RepID=UPI0037B20654